MRTQRRSGQQKQVRSRCHEVTDKQNYCPRCGTRIVERTPAPGTGLIIVCISLIFLSFLPWFRAAGYTVYNDQLFTFTWDAFTSPYRRPSPNPLRHGLKYLYKDAHSVAGG